MKVILRLLQICAVGTLVGGIGVVIAASPSMAQLISTPSQGSQGSDSAAEGNAIDLNRAVETTNVIRTRTSNDQSERFNISFPEPPETSKDPYTFSVTTGENGEFSYNATCPTNGTSIGLGALFGSVTFADNNIKLSNSCIEIHKTIEDIVNLKQGRDAADSLGETYRIVLETAVFHRSLRALAYTQTQINGQLVNKERLSLFQPYGIRTNLSLQLKQEALDQRLEILQEDQKRLQAIKVSTGKVVQGLPPIAQSSASESETSLVAASVTAEPVASVETPVNPQKSGAAAATTAPAEPQIQPAPVTSKTIASSPVTVSEPIVVSAALPPHSSPAGSVVATTLDSGSAYASSPVTSQLNAERQEESSAWITNDLDSFTTESLVAVRILPTPLTVRVITAPAASPPAPVRVPSVPKPQPESNPHIPTITSPPGSSSDSPSQPQSEISKASDGRPRASTPAPSLPETAPSETTTPATVVLEVAPPLASPSVPADLSAVVLPSRTLSAASEQLTPTDNAESVPQQPVVIPEQPINSPASEQALSTGIPQPEAALNQSSNPDITTPQPASAAAVSLVKRETPDHGTKLEQTEQGRVTQQVRLDPSLTPQTPTVTTTLNARPIAEPLPATYIHSLTSEEPLSTP